VTDQKDCCDRGSRCKAGVECVPFPQSQNYSSK
jgi:hypothetical protein